MGQTLIAWETRVKELLGNPSTDLLPSGDVTKAVHAAVRKFSEDRPRVIHVDYSGDGSTFDLAKPASWVDDFSYPVAVEYPQGERQAVYVDPVEVVLYPGEASPTHIRLLTTTPATGKTARLYFGVPWPLPTADAAVDKISDTSFEAVVNLASCYAANELVARTAGHTDSTIPSADAIGTPSESDRWRNVARDKLKIYREHVGAEHGPPPASGMTDWDARSSWLATGGQFLFRGRR